MNGLSPTPGAHGTVRTRQLRTYEYWGLSLCFKFSDVVGHLRRASSLNAPKPKKGSQTVHCIPFQLPFHFNPALRVFDRDFHRPRHFHGPRSTENSPPTSRVNGSGRGGRKGHHGGSSWCSSSSLSRPFSATGQDDAVWSPLKLLSFLYENIWVILGPTT